MISNLELTEDRALPDWSVEEYGSAQEIAQNLRYMWNLPMGPIDNLIEIVESCGVIVAYFRFHMNSVDGVTIRLQDGTPLILLNKTYPASRMRSTLAHELGHVIMHKYPSPNMEEEAWQFASELLMPESEIKNSLHKLDINKLYQLKIKWKCSAKYIISRAAEIKAITANQKRYLMIKLSQSGCAKVEPYEDLIPVEHPTSIKSLLEYLVSELNYTEEEMSKKSVATIKQFNKKFLNRGHGLQLL